MPKTSARLPIKSARTFSLPVPKSLFLCCYIISAPPLFQKNWGCAFWSLRPLRRRHHKKRILTVKILPIQILIPYGNHCSPTHFLWLEKLENAVYLPNILFFPLTFPPMFPPAPLSLRNQKNEQK